MAAGCWVVGYSGGGGRELFRFGASNEVSFGDWPGFVTALQDAFERFALAPRETELRLERQAQAVRVLYSAEQERASIAVPGNALLLSSSAGVFRADSAPAIRFRSALSLLKQWLKELL